MRPVFQPQDIITKWVMDRACGTWTPGVASGFAVVDEEGNILAGMAFTDFNGRNVSAHLAIENKGAARLLFTLAGAYAFEQLGCQRLTLVAESSNLDAVKLHEKLGAVREGCLVGAGRSGDDILISRLTPDCSFWRKLSERRTRKAAVAA